MYIIISTRTTRNIGRQQIGERSDGNQIANHLRHL
jgi:hypothetical protein